MAVRRPIALAASLSLAFSTPVHAWGPQGHEAVGAIADKYINASTRTKIQAILGKGMTLQKAAVWADCAKGVIKDSNGEFVYTGKGKYPECKPFETKAG
ncbi:MAG TPA: S1/P1 nuclease, partial [Burkholderiales bacterium]|nr:S1/P1 nuclease [Burkholderiales bacterium]